MTEKLYRGGANQYSEETTQPSIMVDVREAQGPAGPTDRLQSPYTGPPSRMPESLQQNISQPQHGIQQVPGVKLIKSNSEGPSGPRRVVCPHKKTDFRHALWVKERKALRDKTRKTRFRVEMGKQPKGNTVTVDTSKARSNLDVLRLCLQELNWREYPFGKKEGAQCDIHWHSAHYHENPDLYTGWVNKFPGMVEVVKKVSLTRTLDIMRNLFPDDYDFHPQSWYLPQQFAEFSDAARRALSRQPSSARQKPYYIVKPDEGSQGEGIYLITDPRDYSFNGRQHVVQEYLARPLLLERLKFDLRIYVVLVRLEPLKVYLHSEGLARFCTVPYAPPNHKNSHESFMHLTNYSLNKRSSSYVHTETCDDGSKRTLSSVLRKMANMGYDVEQLQEDIERLVVKTIIAMAPELKVEMNAAIPAGKPGPKCFQILGFDIIIMDDLKPMLLEVNANPSLRIDYEHQVAPGICEYLHSPVDEEIKKSLVLSTLKTIAPKKRRRSRSAKQRCRSETDLRRHENEGEASERERELKPVRKFKSCEGYRNAEVSKHTTTVIHREAEVDKSSESQTQRIPSDPSRRKTTEDNDGGVGEPVNEGVEGEEKEGKEEGEEEQAESEETREQGPDYNPFTHDIKLIYPSDYPEHYNELLIMDKTVDIFLSCLGVRGSLRMGATSFRNFTRKGKLAGHGFTNASLDILFIDLQRRWEYANTGNAAGLCYQGFLEAFFLIAKRRFPSENPLESVKAFLHHCNDHMDCTLESRSGRGGPHLPRLERMEQLERRAEQLKQMMTDSNFGSGRLWKKNLCTVDFRDFPPTSRDEARQRPAGRRTQRRFVDGKE